MDGVIALQTENFGLHSIVEFVDGDKGLVTISASGFTENVTKPASFIYTAKRTHAARRLKFNRGYLSTVL